MDDKILRLLLSKLEERKQGIIDALSTGAAADFAAYQNLVGQVRGLAAAQMEINDLLRKIKESIDEN